MTIWYHLSHVTVPTGRGNSGAYYPINRDQCSSNSESRRDSVGGVVAEFSGGGSSAEFFRGLLKPTRFSGGG